MAVLHVYSRSIEIFTGGGTFETDVIFSSFPPNLGLTPGEAYFIGIDKN